MRQELYRVFHRGDVGIVGIDAFNVRSGCFHSRLLVSVYSVDYEHWCVYLLDRRKQNALFMSAI